MKVLVYPHSMELGGSQLNALELAAAVRDRGHEVLVYSEPGPLLLRVRELGLEHVPRRSSSIRPGPGTAVDLAGLVHARGIDVIHGWEWPPILEGFAAAALRPRVALVGSIMSMSVAPFIPSGVPLTVGTERIRRASAPTRRGPVTLLEPPVDTEANRSGLADGDTTTGSPDGTGPSMRIVVVSRLAAELKLEGLLTAISVVGELALERDVELVVVGDGPARTAVAQATEQANAGAGRTSVLLTGELADPRAAYDCADVCLGMGGSALRALAFAKPLVVQGEGGFFEMLTPGNVDQFLANGWYGVARRDPAQARAHLRAQLEALLDDPELRRTLGAFGRELVEDRFSLHVAAATLEELYRATLASPGARLRTTVDAARSGRSLVSYKMGRRLARRRGAARTDDFNARPV